MVKPEISYDDDFEAAIARIKDVSMRRKVQKQIAKIRTNPRVGKPMRFGRKGTRELYVKPYRLSYIYIEEANKVVVLDFYHKKKQ